MQRERALGRSRGFDARTATRIGKLVGATHLLTGTFTVAGKKMRLDCRLFAVETGAVLLAEEAEGDADSFFELRKTLTRKLLDAISVHLTPNEDPRRWRPRS